MIFNIIWSLQTLRSFRSPALNEIRYGFRNVVQYEEVVEPLTVVFWIYAVLPDFIGDCIFIIDQDGMPTKKHVRGKLLINCGSVYGV